MLVVACIINWENETIVSDLFRPSDYKRFESMVDVIDSKLIVVIGICNLPIGIIKELKDNDVAVVWVHPLDEDFRILKKDEYNYYCGGIIF